MAAAKKAVAGRKGAGMGTGQNFMSRIGEKRCFGSGIGAPQQEYNRVFPVIQQADNMIGENLPANPFMAVGLSCPDCQNRIQQQYSLFCPGGR